MPARNQGARGVLLRLGINRFEHGEGMTPDGNAGPQQMQAPIGLKLRSVDHNHWAGLMDKPVHHRPIEALAFLREMTVTEQSVEAF